MKETRIGVISDTHYTGRQQNIPIEQIKKAFQRTKLIIHAGDITNICLLDILGEIAPVEAVCGNMDDAGISSKLLRSKIIDIDGTLVGVVHGFGSHEGFPGKIFKFFEGDKPDAVVFGHTHTPFNEVINGILYFNPGSPVKPALPYPPSVGLITINAPHCISASIVNLI